MAPQLTAMNGWGARGELAWMAWASISLPVPDSPAMRTERVLPAAIRPILVALRKAADWPTRSAKVYLAPTATALGLRPAGSRRGALGNSSAAASWVPWRRGSPQAVSHCPLGR